MRASRLLTILITLQLRRRVSAQQLADLLEVSKRTIYRDMDELSASGVPVFAERGAEGGFSLLDGFRLQLNGLTSAETQALLLAGIPAAAADLGLDRAASDARLKLLSSLPADARDDAERVASRFHLDVFDWYRRASPPKHLDSVARAVWQAQRLELDYRSWSRSARFTVDPLGLVLKAGRWYLLGRRQQKLRIFRLDKIASAKVLGQGFDHPRSFDLQRCWIEAVRRFEDDMGTKTAVLRISAGMIDYLDRLPADMAEPLAAATPDREGWRQTEVRIEGIAEAAMLLLGFGGEVEVVEPDELRRELAARAGEALKIYRSDQ